METPLKKQTWKPLTAGILNIVNGILSIVGSFITFIFSALISAGSDWAGLNEVNLGIDPDALASILLFIAIIILVLAILQIAGGIFAIKRKLWGLALAGAIAGTLHFTILGILSIIFLAMGKDEFI